MLCIWKNDKSRIDPLLLHSEFKVVVAISRDTDIFRQDAAFGTVPRDKRRQFGPPRVPECREDCNLSQVSQPDNGVLDFCGSFHRLTRFRKSLRAWLSETVTRHPPFVQVEE